MQRSGRLFWNLAKVHVYSASKKTAESAAKSRIYFEYALTRRRASIFAGKRALSLVWELFASGYVLRIIACTASIFRVNYEILKNYTCRRVKAGNAGDFQHSGSFRRSSLHARPYALTPVGRQRHDPFKTMQKSWETPTNKRPFLLQIAASHRSVRYNTKKIDRPFSQNTVQCLKYFCNWL